ncbi:hypothetical protein [Methylosinus sp. PW1]|uniref:hypothetical protein n=1 Tax=Methylosinus sp. PW1 TaxID=107636 RepID=UPI0012EB1A31|nr:hypothetical protein [Methylosinus sp. PW1]
MPDMNIYIPMSRKLYDNVIRFSDGKLDPAAIAEDLLINWIGSELEFGDGAKYFCSHIEDVINEYAPHLRNKIIHNDDKIEKKAHEDRKPLVWKNVSILSGSDVRMAYGGTHHYAKILGGFIVDSNGKQYSPSEWAAHVAGGTSRNAWRDLWFREPLSKTWIPAQLLRDQAANELAGGSYGNQ